MATELVKATLTTAWVDVVGAAAGEEGIFWQNVGSVPAFLSFSTSAPGASDGYVVLAPGLSFQDDTGSAHVWAKCASGSTIICATLDPAGSGTGGGPVTIANGADVAEGTTTDAAYTDVTGATAATLIGLNKGQYVLQAARLGSLTEAAPASDTASSGLNGRLQRIAQRITSLIALLPAALGAGGGLKVDGSGTALPVSAAALPLPTGAATEVTLAAVSGKLPATLGIKTAVGSLSMAPASDASFAITAAALPLPTGAATEATLAAQSAKLPATLGIKTAANSLSIAPASDASFAITAAALPLPAGAATATGLTTINTTLGTPFQAAGALGASAAIIGTVRIDQTTPGTTNFVAAAGNVANGATNSGNPLGIGGVAGFTRPTPVTAGQRVFTWHGLDGALVIAAASRTAITDNYNNSTIGAIAMPDGINVGPLANANMYFNSVSWDKARGDTNGAVAQPFAMASSRWAYPAASGGISNTTTAVTIITAAGVGVRNYLTGMQIDWDSLTTATEVAVRDGASGTVLWRGKLPSGIAGTRTIAFTNPKRGTANTLMEFLTLTATVAGAVYVNADGYQGT